VTEVILITAHGNEDLARDVLRPSSAARAFDYIRKPIDLDELRTVVDRAARQAITSRETHAIRKQAEKSYDFEGIAGTSAVMARVIDRIKRIADSKLTVLINGESGTGKELVALAIHATRRERPSRCASSTAPASTKTFWKASCSAT